ncbi:MAG: hypothetical protein R6V85_01190 [Polyangia bacterium]
MLAIALALGAGAVFARFATAEIFERVVSDEDRYYLPPPIWLRLFSLGYNEAVADVLWITTIVHFGGKQEQWHAERAAALSSGRAAESEDNYTVSYVKAVTDLDPRFRAAYRHGARLTLYHEGRISRRTVEQAIDLLERGLEQFPDDGELAFNLGFMHYYELEPFTRDEKEKRRHRRIGAHLIRRAALLPEAPPYTGLFASTLLRREGLEELVVEHLKAMLVRETSPSIRASLEAQLRRELGEAARRDIERSRRLHARWREEMPYVSFDLYLLLRRPGAEGVEAVLDPLYLVNRLLGIENRPGGGPNQETEPP